MSAFDKGIQIGRETLYRINPKKMTLAELGSIARTSAKQFYKTEIKQREFVQGWYTYTQQYQTMFKDYPTKLDIVGITLKCGHCNTTFEIEFEIEDLEPVSFEELRKAKNEACPICHDTGKVVNHYD